ncbi:Anaphase spindle elongation protein 1 [Phytophthora cinnamomi]|uniref:Anaphase spindle elongation protein 1 n=1 Tax=Phytophthora cinnamomi TaxID=4785 RepID=UPI003559DD09|nr:Anaphase spindle elongation protein 1 [Phytophthora cinnamomi]
MAISDKTSDNSSSSKTQQEFTKLQEQLQNGATEAAGYLDSLKSKFTDYDNSNKSSKETATSYFQAAMNRARASVDQLRRTGEDIRTDGNSASDAVVDSVKRSMDQAGSALDNLGKSAQAYDQHVRDSINARVDNAKHSGAQTASSWQDSISSLVNSTRDATFHGFEALQNQITATQKAMAEQAASAQTAVSDAAGGLANKASDASEKLKPTDASTSKSADQDAGPTLMERATGVVSSSLGYVASAFQGSSAEDSSEKTSGTKSA